MTQMHRNVFFKIKIKKNKHSSALVDLVNKKSEVMIRKPESGCGLGNLPEGLLVKTLKVGVVAFKDSIKNQIQKFSAFVF